MPKPSVALCSAKPITSKVASATSLLAADWPMARPSAKLCSPMPTAIKSASCRDGDHAATITVNSKGDLVVNLDNAGKQSARVNVRALTTIDGKKITLADRTVRVAAGKKIKVDLKVSKGKRAELSHGTHPLEVTATPEGGGGKGSTVAPLRAKA